MRVNLRETDAAYIAGILDGEGYISLIGQRRVRKRYHDVVTDYIPVVNITQGRRELLEHIAKFLDHGYSIMKGGKIGSYYRLHLGSRCIQWLLPQVLPFLVLKRRQAEMVLEYATLRCGSTYKHQYSQIRELGERHYREAKELNSLKSYREKHGIPDPNIKLAV